MQYKIINKIKVLTEIPRPFKCLKNQVINNQVMNTLGIYLTIFLLIFVVVHSFININTSVNIFKIIRYLYIII